MHIVTGSTKLHNIMHRMGAYRCMDWVPISTMYLVSPLLYYVNEIQGWQKMVQHNTIIALHEYSVHCEVHCFMPGISRTRAPDGHNSYACGIY